MVVLGGADDPTHKLGDSVEHTRQQHVTGLPEKPSNVTTSVHKEYVVAE